jgi:hypothetical protein
MMRPRQASLVLLAISATTLLGGALTDTSGAASGASKGAWRTVMASVSPTQNDLALLQIRFSATRGRQRITNRNLKLALGLPIGSDYITLATLGHGLSRSPKALILIVDRPSALLDPAVIRLRVRSSRALGKPRVWTLVNPFTHPSAGLTPALCDLPLGGAAALAAPVLRTLSSQGAGLTGFDSTAAVAQAYDVVCGLPYEASFAQAVTHASSGVCFPSGALCCLPNGGCASPPIPTPAPTPPTPVPSPPGCAPCNPAPGYACPLARASVCAAGISSGARRASLGSH